MAINYFEDERGQVFLVTLLCIYNGNDVAFKAFRAIIPHVKGGPVLRTARNVGSELKLALAKILEYNLYFKARKSKSNMWTVSIFSC